MQRGAERSDKREELQGPKKMVNLISEHLDACVSSIITKPEAWGGQAMIRGSSAEKGALDIQASSPVEGQGQACNHMSLPSGARTGPGTNRTIVLVRYLGDILEETVLTAVLTGVSCSSQMNAQV